MRCRDLGSDTAHWAADGRFPPKGSTVDIGETTLVSGVRDLGIPPFRGSYLGIRFRKHVDLHFQAPEYGCSIHCDMTYSGYFPGGGSEARIAGYQEVVEVGVTEFHGSMGGG